MVQSCIVEAAAAAARQAGRHVPGRATQFEGSTHTMQTEHKNRAPNTYGNPAASCLLLMCCPFSRPSSLWLPFSLTFYRCTADIIWTIFLCASLLVGLSVSRVFRLGLINWVNGAYENLEFAMSRWQRGQHDFNNLLKCARRQKLSAKTKENRGKLLK